MFGNIFYHNIFRKIVISFGTIFNDITVIRRNRQGREVNRIKIPLAYGPREKYLVRILEDPELNRGVNIELPRLAFQIIGITYEGPRKLNTMHKNAKRIVGDNEHMRRAFNPVVYRIGMELYVLSKYIDDANQIVEQILPWFTPDYTVTIKSIPELGLTDDIPIHLTNVSLADNYEEDWVNRRDITWTFQFDIKAPFYGPIKTQDVITKAQTDILVPRPGGDVHDAQTRQETPRSERITVVPDPLDADPEDDFGYTTYIETFTDVKKYDPVSGTDKNVTAVIKPDGIPSEEKVSTFEHFVIS